MRKNQWKYQVARFLLTCVYTVRVGTMSSSASRVTRLRMIERHAARDAAAAIVPDDGELLEAELAHDFDLVLRHRALGVARVIVAFGRLAAVAVAAQVRRDDGEALRERRRDVSPFEMRLRPALQQQHGRPAAADDAVDLGAGRSRCGIGLKPGKNSMRDAHDRYCAGSVYVASISSRILRREAAASSC